MKIVDSKLIKLVIFLQTLLLVLPAFLYFLWVGLFFILFSYEAITEPTDSPVNWWLLLRVNLPWLVGFILLGYGFMRLHWLTKYYPTIRLVDITVSTWLGLLVCAVTPLAWFYINSSPVSGSANFFAFYLQYLVPLGPLITLVSVLAVIYFTAKQPAGEPT